MRRTRLGKLALVGSSAVVLFLVLGAAPAAPTYSNVVRAIDDVQKKWFDPSKDPQQPTAEAWKAYFTALRTDLAAYSAAKSDQARGEALVRLVRKERDLAALPWSGGREVETQLAAWLAPRVVLAGAEKALIDSIKALPPATTPAIKSGRDGWVSFVQNALETARTEFESAPTVVARSQAHERLDFLIGELGKRLEARRWAPGVGLNSSIVNVYPIPNVLLRADFATVAPFFSTDVVQSGPVDYKGQRSFVTAGAKTGFGLQDSDQGIAFFNSQMMTSITPVNGFNEQMSNRDPRGAKATRMYYFSATTRDDSELTIHTLLSAAGLRIWPSYRHNVNAEIDAAPLATGEGKRLFASLLGMNRAKIIQKVYTGAIGPIRQEVDESSMELGTIRTGEAAAERNAMLSKYLPGDGSIVYKDIKLDDVALKSRAQYVEALGKVQWRGGSVHQGAATPVPSSFQTLEPGITANVHLGSLLSNVVQGLVESRYSDVDNLMITLKPAPADEPAKKGFVIQTNVDYATYVHSVDELRGSAASGATVIRIVKPKRAPEFDSDSRGNLVVLVRDFSVEVPAPKQGGPMKGLLGPAGKVYRITSPLAEFDFELTVTPQIGEASPRISLHLIDFDPGDKVQIMSIGDDEAHGKSLTAISRVAVLQGFELTLQSKPIEFAVPKMSDRVVLRDVSKLDPSGWMKIVLQAQAAAPIVPPVTVPVRSADRGEAVLGR